MDEIRWAGMLADLKEDHYRNTLALSAVIELLIEKGLLSREDIRRKAMELDEALPLGDETHSAALSASHGVGRS
jgi:hypothetical protein